MKKIEFFDSDEEFFENAVFIVKRHVFYKNVYVFIKKFKNMIFFRKKKSFSNCDFTMFSWQCHNLTHHRIFRHEKKLFKKQQSSLNEKMPWFIDLKNEFLLFLLNYNQFVISWQMKRQKKIFVLWFKTYFVMLKQLILIRFKMSWLWRETFWIVNSVFKYRNQRQRTQSNNSVKIWIIISTFNTN